MNRIGNGMENEIEFQQLRQFVAVARLGNVTRAAEELGSSQSALSRSIQRLETTLGQPLFERQPRGVELTEMGSFFLTRCHQILALFDDTLTEVADVSKQGKIRLAVIPTIAPYLLPQVLKGFGRRHPDVKIQVQEDTTQNIIRLCKHGEIDLAIVALPIHEKYLEVIPLFDEELVLVFPKGHPLEKQKHISLGDIQSFAFISLDRQHCLSDNIAEFCSRQSFAPIAIERTNQLATIQELVALHHGISIVPDMAQKLDKSKTRVYRSFAGETPKRTIALLRNPYRYESRWVGMFTDYMKTVAAERS